MGVNAIVGLVSAYGAYEQGQAGQSAAQTQGAYGRLAMLQQMEALRQQQELMRPYLQSGQGALTQLTQGMAPGGMLTPQYALQQAAQQGMIGATPFQPGVSPAQQFAQNQALQAMQAQMATGGQGLSSNAIVGAGTLAGNIASQYEQQAFNQWLTGRQQILGETQQQYANLYNMANMGLGATGMQSQNIGTAAQNIGQTQIGIGNALAGGQIAGGQALGGMLGGLTLAGLGGYSWWNQPGGQSGYPTTPSMRYLGITPQDIGSDPSIKENIVRIGALENGLNVYEFDYKEPYKDRYGHGKHIGVMADEVAEVFPDAVKVHPDGYRVVDYSKLKG